MHDASLFWSEFVEEFRANIPSLIELLLKLALIHGLLLLLWSKLLIVAVRQQLKDAPPGVAVPPITAWLFASYFFCSGLVAELYPLYCLYRAFFYHFVVYLLFTGQEVPFPLTLLPGLG